MKEKINILVVEDNILNQKLISFMLNDWGFKFDICSDGKFAMEKLKRCKYDLVLMDIEMPVMDGYETTKYIREKLKLNLPVIAMTGHISASEKEKCLKHGMSDYISKPIKEMVLYHLITDNLAVYQNQNIKK